MTDCYQQQSWRMQIPDDFWRVQDVGFRADEGHAAVLSVHQQLSTEMFTEQVTSSFIIDCTMDAWHDPDSIAALQILPHGHSQNTTIITIIANVLITQTLSWKHYKSISIARGGWHKEPSRFSGWQSLNYVWMSSVLTKRWRAMLQQSSRPTEGRRLSWPGWLVKY